MAGTSHSRLLLCEGFIETSGFEQSKQDLKAQFGLTDYDLDDRLSALTWSIVRDANTNTRRIPDRNLWVAVTPGGIPPLRIYLRPRPEVASECELLWIEERL
jgi:hypothetical protein